MGLAVAVVVGSQFGWTATDHEEAMIRLTWRAPGERVEECRPLTEEERAGLPVHMQPEEVCEGRLVPYVLSMAVDGEAVLSDTLHGAGAREDRPIYVHREMRVPPGTHRLFVSFERAAEGSSENEVPEAVSPIRALETRIDLGSREVLVVTYDPERRVLELVGR